MDNQELKLKFDEIQAKITDAKSKNIDATQYLKEKYNLLKLGYARILRETSAPDFDKNPKKYSTLLSYVNTMKATAKEAGMDLSEAEALETEIKTQMKNNNLDWLLNGQ